MWQITAAQLLELRKAIKSYNSVIGRWQSSGKYELIPNKTTIAQELDYITSNRTFRERVNQLKRASSRVKKDSGKVVMRKGYAVPKYMADEVRNMTRQKNQENARKRKRLIPDYELLKPVEKARILSNKNLTDFQEDDTFADGDPFAYDALLRETYPNMTKRAQVYIDVWLDMNGDPEVARMIMEMAERDPEGFDLLMESADLEKEIEYIYPDTKQTFIGSHSGYEYKRSSAWKGDQTTKMISATNYWIGQYEDFQNGKGYFE